MRYDYATGFKTWAAADLAMGHMYACGDISDCEHARIERRGDRYVITLYVEV